MFKRKWIPLISLLLALATSATGEATPANAGDLELDCRPVYAVEDFRSERPADVRGVPAPYTFYLFGNADLMQYRVSLSNIGPQPVKVGELDWPAGLEVAISRNGELLDPASVRLEVLRKTVTDTVYYWRQEQIENVSFVRREKFRGSDPIQEYDDLKEKTREVEDLPQSLRTYQALAVEFALTGADGEPLPAGIYRLDFAEPGSGVRCDHPQQLVLRAPKTDLDRVDEQIVRYRFAEQRGDLEAAGRHLRRATELAPGNLKAWYYLNAHAYATRDLETQLLATLETRQLLGSKTAENQAVSPQVKVLARSSIERLDALKAKVEAARAAAGEDLLAEDLPAAEESR